MADGRVSQEGCCGIFDLSSPRDSARRWRDRRPLSRRPSLSASWLPEASNCPDGRISATLHYQWGRSP